MKLVSLDSSEPISTNTFYKTFSGDIKASQLMVVDGYMKTGSKSYWTTWAEPQALGVQEARKKTGIGAVGVIPGDPATCRRAFLWNGSTGRIAHRGKTKRKETMETGLKA